MDARVNEAVQQALSQRTIGAPQAPDVVISPTIQRRSSCASTAAPDVQAEQLQIEAPAPEQQRYPVDDITIPTTCEVHVRVKNISVQVAHGSALPVNPASTIHGMPIPPGYTSVTVEQIVEPTHINENLELDFVGGDCEKMLGDAPHGIVLWRKADIKVIANNKAPVDPPPSAPSPLDYGNYYRDPTPLAPSPPQQRPGSTQTPPATEEKGKKKTSSLPLAGPPNMKSKWFEKKICPKKKLAYELTREELDEEVARDVKEQLKPKVPEKRVPVDPEIAAKVYKCLNNPPPTTKVPSDFDWTLINAQQQRNQKCGKTIPQLGTVRKEIEPLLVLREQNQTVDAP